MTHIHMHTCTPYSWHVPAYINVAWNVRKAIILCCNSDTAAATTAKVSFYWRCNYTFTHLHIDAHVYMWVVCVWERRSVTPAPPCNGAHTDGASHAAAKTGWWVAQSSETRQILNLQRQQEQQQRAAATTVNAGWGVTFWFYTPWFYNFFFRYSLAASWLTTLMVGVVVVVVVFVVIVADCNSHGLCVIQV